jgi:hydrogenase expression/formation protein HypD
MRYVDEYRNPEQVKQLAHAIGAATTQPWNIMEVCGGQTHAIIRFGLDELLPRQITLIHGPGCPVCVTPVEILDKAIAIASHPGVIFCSFGDMLRVPGSQKDLFMVKSEGGDVRVVYSPMDAVTLAQKHADREVVFFAVGFETTAPANAMAVAQAARLGLKNFSVLVSHVLVPPAIRAVLSSPANRVQAFIAAGHVCTITGMEEYRPIAAEFRVPIVITGFEPLDIMQGVLMCVRQLEAGRHEVENQYARSVRPQGNVPAKKQIEEIFQIVPPAAWLCARRSRRLMPNSISTSNT